VGDRVPFGKYSSSEIGIDGEELLIMREDETGNHHASVQLPEAKEQIAPCNATCQFTSAPRTDNQTKSSYSERKRACVHNFDWR
jgi:hypothetical protein